jgi:hypothetical protein
VLQLLVLSLLAANNSALAVDVTTLRGDHLAGTLVAATAQEITLQTEQGRQVLPAGELLSLVPSNAVDSLPFVGAPATTVQLVDGSQLRATDYSVNRGRATIRLSGGGVAKVSTKSIQHVCFKKQDAALQQQWQRILDSDRSGDVIVVRKTSQPTEDMPLVVALDHLEGILGDTASDTVVFEFDGLPAKNVSRSKVEGLIYHHARAAPRSNLVCQLVDLWDTRWNVKSLEIRQSELALVSSAGVRFSLPLNRIAKLDYSAANMVYLSELEPESQVWRPHVFSRVTPPSVSQWFRPRDKLPMLLKGQRYENGLTLHSRTRLTYRLSRGYDRFLATVGIDDRYRSEGHVFLQITGDKGVLFESQVRGGENLLKLDLDIGGVRRLAILVDFGEDGTDRGDHLNLCNARLTK